MSRRRFLDRTHRQRERQREDGRGFSPTGMFKLAGFGAAVLIFLAVYIGFHREQAIEGGQAPSVLERLVAPLVFGINALELIAILIAAMIAWRIWRRM